VWRREYAHEPRNIARIAERLRLLHGLAAPAGLRRVDFAAQAASLEAQLCVLADARGPGRAACDAPGNRIEPASRSVAAIRCNAAAAFETLAFCGQRLVPCHNDLHHLNLLDDGSRLWIVDWEYGGVGDPLYDLASFASQHEFTAAERAALLDAYGAASDMQAAALDAACAAFDYVQWLWYSVWAARHPGAGRGCAARAAVLGARLAAART
jgi:thiamine kinase